MYRLRGGADLEALKQRGNSLFQQGKFADARKVYSEALDSTADHKAEVCQAILRNRAAACMKLGEYQDAINDCTEVLLYDTKCTKAKLRRALAVDKLNDKSLFPMGYRDCRELLHEGEGGIGHDTLKEVKRIFNRLRNEAVAGLKDEDLCKQIYDDAAHCINYRKLNLIDWALEDLNIALNWLDDNKDGDYNGTWAQKCLEMRLDILKQLSQYDALGPDLDKIIELHPQNITYRLMRCKNWESCERWKKCLVEAKAISAQTYGKPSIDELTECEGYIKRMTFFVEKIMGGRA
eukprot:CAMPEP_0167744356 /NCGR_PEP_ID=MMETSP0110_2-20121227/2544_1 /TAXON_ID=629695 /ORGANISM="Gymnochlora sp., Strain CCMP2014" /LENGTH=291 /DNA_ID=CAMNT_0007628865 /DNA_START=105 /DNA_END=980 /DNA_ORIENTATION=+